jgi:dipeptidyl aminopeptidase/acylaminoacyl peptidase
MGLPPTILHVHSGPTRLTEVEYNPEAAYFTSRGYAWLEVNYRGSSGYGRSYQQALNGQWGKIDVEDTISAARALVSDGLADPQRMAVFGGSAGGFTVLNTLAHFPGVFKAGVSRYGVANLFNLVKTPPKLELHYHETLVGPLPAAEDLYRQRSPVFHAGQIRDPLALFQGSDDPVVPPEQAEEMAAALAKHGTACFYRLYSGEGHGFRRTETITDFYQQMEIFLQRYLLEN